MAKFLIAGDIKAETYMDDSESPPRERFVSDPIMVFLNRSDAFSLNALWAMSDAGMISYKRMIELYIQIGYTLSGFGDIFPSVSIKRIEESDDNG